MQMKPVARRRPRHMVASIREILLHSRRAFALTWSTSRPLTICMMSLTAISGLLPAISIYIAGRIVDSVVAANQSGEGSDVVLRWILAEAVALVSAAAISRASSMCTALLRHQLAYRVNRLVIEKCQELELLQFEDAEFYDKLNRIRRESASRPLSLVSRAFALLQQCVQLCGYGTLLFAFSPWAPFALFLAAIPAFLSEFKFSNEAFNIFQWRSPLMRKQMYLETVLTREDFAKEVMQFQLANRLIKEHYTLFRRLYQEMRGLTIRRNVWGFGLGLIGSIALYGGIVWVALSTVAGAISFGSMTAYFMTFRQGFTAVTGVLSSISGAYDDNLYLSSLFEFLESKSLKVVGSATEGIVPNDGIRFERVTFRYPGAQHDALQNVSLHIPPGSCIAIVGQNGSGKTTFVKLLMRLYHPTKGRILVDGLDLREWEESALRNKMGAIFQDYIRFQMLVGENIGIGDERYLEEEARWERAAEKGLASEFIERLPGRYRSQLGKWFKDGEELSGGQWQRIALARAFMREDASILVLDEPSAAMDSISESQVFARLREEAKGRIVILISHRFSVIRVADRIVVFNKGRISENGSHADLIESGGEYSQLFSAQARAFA